MNDINYTIIIPHKNIPELLSRCIQSIPKRNDTEIIIIDDNSSDENKKKIITISESRQNTTCIINSYNKGAGHARNIGMQKAKGKWIIFADADDFFNYSFNDLLNDMLNVDCDLIFFNANSLDTTTYLPANRANHLNSYIKKYAHNKNEAETDLRYRFGEPWSRIIRKEIIDQNNIKFDETPIHNDTTFSYLVGFHARKIAVDYRASYCITVRSGSITTTIDEFKELTRIEVFARKEQFCKSNNIHIRPTWHYYQLAQFLLRNRTIFLKGQQVLLDKGYNRISIYLNMIYPLIRVIIRKFLNICINIV